VRAFEHSSARGVVPPAITDIGLAVLDLAGSTAERVLEPLGLPLETIRAALAIRDGGRSPGFESRLPPPDTRLGRLARNELTGVFMWAHGGRHSVALTPSVGEGYVRGSLDTMLCHGVLSEYEHEAWLWRLTNEFAATPTANEDRALPWPRLEIAHEATVDGVLAQLERILVFSQAAGAAAGGNPLRTAIERAYIGGAVTALAHLEFITPEQFAQWSDRLTKPLPPVMTITMGSVR
jgi:hypothetical protein